MRASIVYTLLVCAFFLLVIFNKPNKSAHSRKHGPGRRLIVRHTYSNNDTVQAAFDPVVAEMEWRRENRDWERDYFREKYEAWGDNSGSGGSHQPEHHAQGYQEQPSAWEDELDSEDYLNNEDHFNISHRLEVLFPLLDTNPKDGYVSLTELQDWHVEQTKTLMKHRVDRQFDSRDANRDGLISIHEYLPQYTAEQLANASVEHGDAGWWREHFDLADIDGDGGLNRTEFYDFLHPEESTNPKLHQWLRKEQIRDNDHDKDGKLNQEEFDHLFDILKYYGEDLQHLHQGNDAEARKQKFAELDKNKDGFLTEDELEPVMSRLNPGDTFYAKQQAEYLIQQADEDKDGRLTLGEMLEHPYVFYSTAYTHDDEYDGYHGSDHDEFR